MMRTLNFLKLLPLLLSTNLMVQTRCQASTDVLPSADMNQKMAISQQQQMQQLQQNHNPMSCYVCSTMDYENTADNLCRVMKPHHRSPASFHQQPPNLLNVGHHPTSSMMSYPQSTTTTTTTTISTTTSTSPSNQISAADSNPHHSPLVGSTNQNVMSPNEGAYTSTTGYYDESTSGTSFTDSSLSYNQQQSPVMHHTNMSQQYDDSQLVNASTLQHQQQSTSMVPGHHGYYPQNQHRSWPPSNYIRTRQCLEDENFCSIVSVVRIEFVNDSLLSRFWAMERNCSKSCNTGCMLIGERVRLRVCSQCCRTPNCNIRSGTLATKLTSSPYHPVLLITLSLIISLLIGSNSIKLKG